MDAQATVLAAERAAPKVVAARKEELDLEQRMQLVFEREEMQQEQEQQSAAREDQQERFDEPASQKYEDGNACGGAPLEMVGATQQQAADGRRQRAVQCKDAKRQEQEDEGDTPEQQQPGVPVRELATVPVSQAKQGTALPGVPVRELAIVPVSQAKQGTIDVLVQKPRTETYAIRREILRQIRDNGRLRRQESQDRQRRQSRPH